jgi:hypothetical protein
VAFGLYLPALLQLAAVCFRIFLLTGRLFLSAAKPKAA